MSDDQFTRLFKYLQEFRKEMNERFATVHKHIDTLYGSTDDLNEKAETCEQERLATNRQLDRHEGWIGQLAENTETKLIPKP